MPRLSQTERIQITTLHDEGWSNSALARRFGVQRKTIISLINKHENNEPLTDRTHPRRPRKTTLREDRILGRLSIANPTSVSRSLHQQWSPHLANQVTTRTVRNRLIEAGISCRIAKKKPILSLQHKRRRLQWAEEHLNWTPEDWQRVIFSDEVPLQVIQQRSRRYVRSRGGVARQYRPTIQAGGGQIMIWGAFWHGGVLPLQRIQGNLKTDQYLQLLQRDLLPLFQEHNNLTYQQDNARCHVSRQAQNWFNENGIRLMVWPPQSPDLNPIENCWSVIKSELDKVPIVNTQQLFLEASQVGS